jgi:hypothetical protein
MNTWRLLTETQTAPQGLHRRTRFGSIAAQAVSETVLDLSGVEEAKHRAGPDGLL